MKNLLLFLTSSGSFIKKFAFPILFSIVFIMLLSYFRSCNIIHNNTTGVAVIQQLKTFTPTTAEAKDVPVGDKAEGVIRLPRAPKTPIGTTAETSLVISSACNTCISHYTEVVKVKTIIGISFKPKFFIGGNINGLTLGYDQELFRIGRYSLDGLVSVPYFGTSVSYSITQNFFGLAGVQYQYFIYNPLTNENVGLVGLITPVIGCGFAF